MESSERTCCICKAGSLRVLTAAVRLQSDDFHTNLPATGHEWDSFSSWNDTFETLVQPPAGAGFVYTWVNASSNGSTTSSSATAFTIGGMTPCCIPAKEYVSDRFRARKYLQTRLHVKQCVSRCCAELVDASGRPSHGVLQSDVRSRQVFMVRIGIPCLHDKPRAKPLHDPIGSSESCSRSPR